jgi:hypothetical protein
MFWCRGLSARFELRRLGTRRQGAFELRWFNWIFALGDEMR